jgi:hypothetical protein
MKSKLPPEVREFFVQKGKEGGKLSGAARMAKLTAEQRREIARKAVQARWTKAKKRKGNAKASPSTRRSRPSGP